MSSERVVLTLFSDPMMGLAYECEPTLDLLASHYDDALDLRHAMVVLVRDVADFMTQDELRLPADEGLRRYNARLAQIYKDEEPLGGLPMNMESLHLFDPERRSSEPLCLAFEAVRIATPERAETYLRALRRATIVDGRMTTCPDVLRAVAEESEIDLVAFDEALGNESARTALERDQLLASRVGVQGLPALLIETNGRAVLTSPLAGYESLVHLIDQLR